MTRFFGVDVIRYVPSTPYLPSEWSDMIASWCGGLTGKRIMEVGCDVTGRLVKQICELYRPEEIVGINPLVQLQRFGPNCRIEAGDVRSIAYAEGYFDVILSSSAFEHIHNFDVALAEMYRILKPGGYLFSTFGPIWSASYGHHLWLSRDGKLYTYWNVVLPPYCHLLMNPRQIAGLLAGEYPSDVCDAIGEYVCNSTDENQLFFEDYETIVKKSPFEIILFKGIDDPVLSDKYNRQITPKTFEMLKEKYPGRRHFFYDGISVLLKKPGGDRSASSSMGP
jgi:SAM-dependent methyltransferase